MPNNYDFSKLKNIKTTEVYPDGWISPIKIEYGEGFDGGVPSYFWRVKGTSHTFVIPILRMDFLSEGDDYNKHFKEILEGFKKDLIQWKSEGWYMPWMQEYRDEYREFVSI